MNLIKILFVFLLVGFCVVLAEQNASGASGTSQEKKPHILLVHFARTWGGISQHVNKLYKALLDDEYKASILIATKSRLKAELDSQGLDYVACDPHSRDIFNIVKQICQEKKIDLIHFNWPPTLAYTAAAIKRHIRVQTIFTHHGPWVLPTRYLKCFDYVSGVNKSVVEQMQEKNRRKKLKVKKIIITPPAFDDVKFTSFKPQYSKSDFFEKYLGITLMKCPTLCMVANLSECKDHQFLFAALHKLIYEFKQPVQMMLAGEGALKNELQNLSKALRLQDFVHFLGFTKDIPELLYHSDIKVLSSQFESFGVALVEAALMKKPIIISQQIGAADLLILHEKTGLLYKHKNVDDLALSIKRLIDEPLFAEKLGRNACNHIRTNFSSTSIISKIKNFYDDVHNKRS